MKLIPICGLLPFLYLVYQYNSYRAYIILVNGTVYHYNHTSQYLRLQDIICNFFIGSYIVYNYPDSYFLSLIIASIFISNNIAYAYYNLDETISYLIHVFAVQWLTFYEIWRELML